MKLKLHSGIALVLGFFCLIASNLTASADPYGYDSRDRYNDYDRDSSYEDRREQEKLDRDRRDLERERDRLDYDRRRLEEDRRQEQTQYAPPARVQEHCPSGFSPSENKCSVEERRRGCKDMRLPGGLGCVHR